MESAEARPNDMILRHERELTRLCCAYLGDAALAQDAVQETFPNAYPGVTDAIAVTEKNRTTIYMRQTLEKPIEYIRFDSLFIAEEERRSPVPWYDEICYEISGIAQSVDDLLALLPVK